MRVELRLGGLIEVNGREIALGQTHALLDGVGRERSVSAVATRLGISYRSAWGRVQALEEALGQPVVIKTKGHGSVLTEFGARLRDALGATLATFEEQITHQETALQKTLAGLLNQPPVRLRAALSHDPLLLGAFADAPSTEIRIVGSMEAATLLLGGEADFAGFHAGGLDLAAVPAFQALLASAHLQVMEVFAREQGFMVAAGNPLAIRSAADLARSHARFVNRQRNSGTRAWFDRLLDEAGVPPSAIQGYAVEEFTHQAVAAVIAAGAAHAGMGVRWIAERFGLGFVPVGQETYYLAGHSETLARLMEQLAPVLRTLAPQMAGYTLLLEDAASGSTLRRKRPRAR